MKYCLEISSDYFQLTHRFVSIHLMKLNKRDLIEYQQCLSQLHQTILRLENEHQRTIDGFYSYSDNQIDEWILLPLSSMFYSILQLAHSILQLGTTIHELLELETTNFYQPF